MLSRKDLLKKVAIKLSKVSQIRWVRPKFRKEFEGYFGKGDTKEAFLQHGLNFNTEKELLDFLSSGSLQRLKEDALKEAKNMTTSFKDFTEKLKDQVFSYSFKKMERDFLSKDLNLEAPIVIKFADGTYWGFSGNRRANLARKYGLPVVYYVVDQKKYDIVQKKLKKLYEKDEEAKN